MSGLASAAGAEAVAGTSGGTPTNRILLWLLIGLAATAAVLLVALPIARRRTAPAANGYSTRDELVDALARLDMAYQAGELSEAAYRDQRLLLKAQLRDLTQ